MDTAIRLILSDVEARGAPLSTAVGGLLPLLPRVEFRSLQSRACWGADSVLLLG